VRLSRQLDDPQAITGGFGVNQGLGISTDCRDDILVVAPIPSRQTWILADIQLAFFVKRLVLRVKLSSSRQSTPGSLLFQTKVRGRCGFSRSGYGFVLLGAASELECPELLAIVFYRAT